MTVTLPNTPTKIFCDKSFVGKNTDFLVLWDFHFQRYTVYYKEKIVAVKCKFSEIKSYLD